MSEHLFEKMTPSRVLVLTANSRLARYLHTCFDLYQKEQGLTVWETPQILPLHSWLTQQFHLLNTNDQLLLTPFQEDCIWQELVSKSKLDLLQPMHMSKLVKQAYDLLQNWNISLDTLTPFLHQPEVQHLLGWITAFQKQCDEKKWITASALPKWIQNHNDRLSLPEKIMLMGFDDLHPAIKSLFSLLEKKCVI